MILSILFDRPPLHPPTDLIYVFGTTVVTFANPLLIKIVFYLSPVNSKKTITISLSFTLFPFLSFSVSLFLSLSPSPFLSHPAFPFKKTRTSAYTTRCVHDLILQSKQMYYTSRILTRWHLQILNV